MASSLAFAHRHGQHQALLIASRVERSLRRHAVSPTTEGGTPWARL
jgi:hypothetical protein